MMLEIALDADEEWDSSSFWLPLVRKAAEAAMQTHGGFSYAKEYDIERKWREVRLYQIAPVSTNLVLAYLGQHVLGMERSY